MNPMNCKITSDIYFLPLDVFIYKLNLIGLISRLYVCFAICNL